MSRVPTVEAAITWDVTAMVTDFASDAVDTSMRPEAARNLLTWVKAWCSEKSVVYPGEEYLKKHANYLAIRSESTGAVQYKLQITFPLIESE